MAAVAAPPSDRGYSGFVSGQASCHDHDGGPVHHGLVVSGPAFVVADQPAVPQRQPKVRSTTHRRLTTWKPGLSLRLMICKVRPAACFIQMASGFRSEEPSCRERG